MISTNSKVALRLFNDYTAQRDDTIGRKMKSKKMAAQRDASIKPN